MTSKLLKRMYSLSNLELAWRVIHQNGRFSKSEDVRADLQKFGEDASGNLRKIQHSLARKRFTFAPAKGIPVSKTDDAGKKTGKFRPIVLAPVESRIVHRAILNVLLDVPKLKPFIMTEFSFGGLRAEEDVDPDRPSVAVPGAIQAALECIGHGATFCATADIRAFFTRISKSTVRAIIAEAVNDSEFMNLFDDAITVELSNMALLRERADLFPTEDIGVAQGNSLSPLLGNIYLAEFDRQMNEGGCSCLRYIDDLVIFGPSEKACNNRLKRAVNLLAKMGMELSAEKSSKGASAVSTGFEFLGIEVVPGLIRPSSSSQRMLLGKVDKILEEGRGALVTLRSEGAITREMSLLSVLRRLDGTVGGWGKHYWFCNDGKIFNSLDDKIWKRVGAYLGCYSDVRGALAQEKRPLMLGLTQLGLIERRSLAYPKSS